MNVDVVGRIRPSVRGEGGHGLDVDGSHRLVSGSGGNAFTFQTLHGQATTNADIYRKSFSSLLDLHIAGFNTCLLVTGESGSGKALAVAGESGGDSGLVALILEDLFKKIGEDERYMYDKPVGNSNRVKLQVCEIYNELVRDLLLVPGLSPEYLEVTETADLGMHIKNLRSSPVPNSAEGISMFRQAWARRTERQTDFGPARNHSAVVIYIDLELQTHDSVLPNKSRFAVVVTPGAEKLTEDGQQLRMREGISLSKGMLSLAQLAAALANQPFPDRMINYGDSKLTSLLQDELGGNCKTRVLLCLHPHTEVDHLSILLHFATQLAAIKNFPVLNDPFAQSLIIQYRTAVLTLKQQYGYTPGMSHTATMQEAQDELRRVQTENISLRDQNERLHQKLGQLQGKFGTLATTKTDLSAQLLMTEEEKLKVSKTLVDMQIENNKLREESEAVKFDMTNKILSLDHEMMQVQMERDRYASAASNAKDRLGAVEHDRKQLADQFVTLKADLQAIKDAHANEVSKNEELSVELLNLVNAKAALLHRLQRLEAARRPRIDSPSLEIERVKAIISRHSMREPEELRGTARDRDNLEKDLFGNHMQLEEELRDLQDQHTEDMRRINAKMTSLQRELQEARNQARERQRTNAELHAKLLLLESTNSELKAQGNRMQHKLKDINDNFRSRLVKYVEDIANYMNQKQEAGSKSENWPGYVDKMLEDLRKAHRIREDQLSGAAIDFRDRMIKTARKHEELLVAYRDLREQVMEHDIEGIDLGPSERDLELSDSDLTSMQQQEIRRLQEDLSQARMEVDSLRLKLHLPGQKEGGEMQGTSTNPAESLDSLAQQVRQFTMTTQQELEEERAQLLTRIALLEGENTELQQYIDSHLLSYKDEILRLRAQLDDRDPGGFSTPPLRTGKKPPHRI